MRKAYIYIEALVDKPGAREVKVAKIILFGLFILCFVFFGIISATSSNVPILVLSIGCVLVYLYCFVDEARGMSLGVKKIKPKNEDLSNGIKIKTRLKENLKEAKERLEKEIEEDRKEIKKVEKYLEKIEEEIEEEVEGVEKIRKKKKQE